MQRHEHRSETWNIVSGNAHVKMKFGSGDPFDGCAVNVLHPANPVDIPKNVWCQISVGVRKFTNDNRSPTTS